MAVIIYFIFVYSVVRTNEGAYLLCTIQARSSSSTIVYTVDYISISCKEGSNAPARSRRPNLFFFSEMKIRAL